MFVEGTTEQVFADTVLKPHLANHSVYRKRPLNPTLRRLK